MIKTTRWSPDTCACVVEYQWDDSVPASSRTHTISNIVKSCGRHSSVTDMAERWIVVEENNKRKNKMWDRIEKDYAEALETTTWQYLENGTLEVTSPSLTQQQKTAAKAWCDFNLGQDSVVFV